MGYSHCVLLVMTFCRIPVSLFALGSILVLATINHGRGLTKSVRCRLPSFSHIDDVLII